MSAVNGMSVAMVASAVLAGIAVWSGPETRGRDFQVLVPQARTRYGVADGAENLIDRPPLSARLVPPSSGFDRLRPTLTKAAALLVSGTATLLDTSMC